MKSGWSRAGVGLLVGAECVGNGDGDTVGDKVGDGLGAWVVGAGVGPGIGASVTHLPQVMGQYRAKASSTHC